MPARPRGHAFAHRASSECARYGSPRYVTHVRQPFDLITIKADGAAHRRTSLLITGQVVESPQIAPSKRRGAVSRTFTHRARVHAETRMAAWSFLP
jgi:hypothetical protein